MSNNSELGMLIDCNEQEFKDFCKDKDLGYLLSFRNLMIQMFNEVQGIKDELVAKIVKDSKTGVQTEESKKILEGMYSKLLRIEQRVFILKDLIDSRSIS